MYDRLDRPVATGPAFSPFGDSTIGMSITEYDAFGRITQTGWKTMTVNETNRNTWQTNINSGSNPFALTTNDILSKNYYDNYSFPDAPTVPSTVEGQAVATGVKGLATGTWLRLITGPTTLYGATSYTLYDTKYRPIRSHANNPSGGYTRTDSKLDFIGKTLYTKTFHKRVAADAEIILTDTFTYSAQDRLLLHTQQIGSGAVQLIASNTYDELGQLKSRKVGGVDPTGALGLQKVDYTYNIRGWLKKINDTDNLTQGADPQDLFAFALNYQDNPSPKKEYTVPKLYNGNISETFWRTGSDNILRKYGYNYDNLNRLTKATYQKPETTTPVRNSYNETLAYDKNGNITGLTRTGEYDDAVYQLETDNLAYTYDTNKKNQLMKVFDSSNNPNGFKDDSTGTSDPADDYTYDANGNMTSDANKGITAIVYNHLNLPTKISFGGTDKIEYLYNAAAVKLQKTVTQNSSVTTTMYFDGFQYVNNILQFFPHAEGYVNNTVVNGNNVYNYAFHYTDHLGNVRLTYGINPDTGLVTVMEESNYYPFGLKHMNYNVTQQMYVRDGGGVVLGPCSGCPKRYQYKYNGKELQDELGLNVYDYGARNYDGALGRFINMDKFSEVYSGISPYSYTLNNPILFIDPDGNYIDDAFIYQKDKNGKYVSPALVKAYEAFAKSKTGIAFLANFAEKGQVIAGHRYGESGKFDKKNIDLNFAKRADNDYANARTGAKEKSNGDGLNVTIFVTNTGTSPDGYITEIGHEAFTHADKHAEDYADDKELNLSSIDKDIRDWATNAVKDGYPKGWVPNLVQHQQETEDKVLEKKLLPILQEYYKNNNIKKPVSAIKKQVNGYVR